MDTAPYAPIQGQSQLSSIMVCFSTGLLLLKKITVDLEMVSCFWS